MTRSGRTAAGGAAPRRVALALVSALVALGGGPGVAAAAVVQRLSPAELVAGSDAVVEGEVAALRVDWDRRGRGLETTVTVVVHRLLAGAAPAVLEVVQPGGTLGGARHLVPGLPVLTLGEEVRLHLRRRRDGRGFRVYGWAQGKWSRGGAGDFRPAPASPATASAAPGLVLTPRPVPGDPPRPFTLNGMVWPADRVPVPYLVNPQVPAGLPFADALAAVQAAFATWAAVPCSTLDYAYAGETDLGVAVDGQNVILWMDDPEEWIWGHEAAAATSLWIPIPEERTADVAFNAIDFEWGIAPEPWLAPHVLDIQAVLTHELGHFSGLSHTERAVDTMYYAWRPWPGQRTLSEDDKLGLCSLYPQEGDECVTAADCPPEETCDSYPFGTLCTRPPDPVGAPCDYTRVECEHFCLFTRIDLSQGYCSAFCTGAGECPAGYRCDLVGTGTPPLRACLAGGLEDAGAADAAPPPDAGAADRPPSVDSGGGCAADPDCPAGQHCRAGPCTFDCRTGADCPSGRCDDAGRCAAEGGCAAGGARPRAGDVVALAVLTLLGGGGAWRRRRPGRAPPRPRATPAARRPR